MKLITVEKIYNCLKNENPEIILDKKTMEDAREPIMKMMQIYEKLGL
jgi:quinolinate synthase